MQGVPAVAARKIVEVHVKIVLSTQLRRVDFLSRVLPPALTDFCRRVMCFLERTRVPAYVVCVC